MRYFYSPGTCSLAGMISLEVTKTPYEAISVDLMGDRTELLAVNPVGKVPTLDANGFIVTETTAIIYWLARRFPDADLLPKTRDEATSALSMMNWFSSVVHILRRQLRLPILFGVGEKAQEELRDAAKPRYWSELQRIDQLIADGRITSLGVGGYALLFYHWGMIDEFPMEKLDAYSKFAHRMIDLPEVVRALEYHNSPILERL